MRTGRLSGRMTTRQLAHAPVKAWLCLPCVAGGRIWSPRVSSLAGCGKTGLFRNTPRSAHVACRYQNRPQDEQKGRPARPQRAKWRIVLVPYGEPLSDARTPLADFFRILLGLSHGSSRLLSATNSRSPMSSEELTGR